MSTLWNKCSCRPMEIDVSCDMCTGNRVVMEQIQFNPVQRSETRVSYLDQICGHQSVYRFCSDCSYILLSLKLLKVKSSKLKIFYLDRIAQATNADFHCGPVRHAHIHTKHTFQIKVNNIIHWII